MTALSGVGDAWLGRDRGYPWRGYWGAPLLHVGSEGERARRSAPCGAQADPVRCILRFDFPTPDGVPFLSAHPAVQAAGWSGLGVGPASQARGKNGPV
jgi:hypothetical protein